MKAIIIHSYGPPEVLQEATVPEPKVGSRQLLIEVKAAGVNPLDWKIRKGNFRFITGRRFPKILGSDVAGIVKETGKNISDFKAGDEVMAMVNVMTGQGGYAEFAITGGKYACKKPENLSFVEAAAVPGSALTALQVLRSKVHLKKGQHLLVNGASGGVGTYGIQIANILGASVTGVCSGRNKDLVTALGAHRIIDYTEQDFTRQNLAYDVIFDTVGNLEFAACRRVLSPAGTFITIVPSAKKILFSLVSALLPGRKCRFASAMPNKDDLLWLKEMIEKEKLRVVLDRTYPLEQAREAHEYMEKGHARGKVVLTV
ncbi:MAG: zinc-binding alcohol dehydrogenase [Desulfobacterales bacterium SG8_35]|nr:MAG: zinc-binding alcohol dehydrogenase [Desulfobacterales bacterium SG8_35]